MGLAAEAVAVTPGSATVGDTNVSSAAALRIGEIGTFEVLLFSVFALLNLLCFKAIIGLAYFSSVRDQIAAPASVIALIFSVGLIGVCWGTLVKPGVSKLLEGSLTPAVCQALALICLLCGQVYSAFSDISSVVEVPLIHSFILVTTLLALYQVFSDWAQGKLVRSSRVRLSDAVERIRLLTESHSLDASSSTPYVERFILPKDLVPGMIFRVRAGEVIPVDGTVVGGIGEVEERRFSGMSHSRVRGMETTVFAGSLLLSGELDCKALGAFDDATITMTEAYLPKPFSPTEPTAEASTWIGNLIASEVALSFALLFAAAAAGIFWHERGASVGAIAGIVASVLLVGVLMRVIDSVPHARDYAIALLYRMGVLCRNFTGFEKLVGISNILVDVQSGATPGGERVQKFEILDDRIEKKGLISVLISILSRSESDVSSTLIDYLRPRIQTLTPFEVKNFSEYEGFGICGTVQGVEFSIGNESLLIERGVHLQQGDLDTSADRDAFVYVALDDEVAARFQVARKFEVASGEAVAKLKAEGRKLYLASLERSDLGESVEGFDKEVDRIGEALGLEPAQVLPRLRRSVYAEKIRSLAPVVIYGGKNSDRGLVALGDVSCSVFDDVVCEVDRADLVLFRKDFGVIPQVLSLSRGFRFIKIVNLSFAALLGGVLVILSFMGLLSAGIVALTAMLFSLFAYLNIAGLELR